MAKLVAAEYEKRQGKNRRVTPVTLGYEARCALPHAFDVILGSQLGVGAYRALVEKQLNRVLVSVSGQLSLKYVSFDELINPQTLVTVVRRIEPGSDFQRLARFLEEYAHD
jgi:6-phosphofructokinase 1